MDCRFFFLVKGCYFIISQVLFIFKVNCTQRAMETDAKASRASECDKPILSQQESKELARPVFAQVSITYRSVPDSDYGYLNK